MSLPLSRHRLNPLSYSPATASLIASLVIWAAFKRDVIFSPIPFGKISSHVWEKPVVPAEDREKPENFIVTAML